MTTRRERGGYAAGDLDVAELPPPPQSVCASPARLRPPAFASPSDPDRLLGAVADALNQCERHGLAVDLEHGAVLTTRGYVLPVGESRLGSRWAVRSRLEAGGSGED